MLELLWLIPALPLASFVILALAGRRMSSTAVAALGAGSIGASAVVSILVAAAFIASPPARPRLHAGAVDVDVDVPASRRRSPCGSTRSRSS